MKATTRQDDAGVAPGLKRTVGVPGAVLMGLGSILGTGIFVSIGIAAGVTGPSVVLAVLVAAVVARLTASRVRNLPPATLSAAAPTSTATAI